MDYSSLSDHLKDLEDPDDIKKITDKMGKTMAEQSMKLQKIHAPNFKVCSLRLVEMIFYYLNLIKMYY